MTLILSILIAIFAFKMPIDMAFAAAGYGFLLDYGQLRGLLSRPCCLYKLTVASGQLNISAARLSPSPTIQQVAVFWLVSPWCVAGRSGWLWCAVTIPVRCWWAWASNRYTRRGCVVANTAPVAFGALGVPILVAGQVTGDQSVHIRAMAASVPFL
ncbi:L-lactate permease [Escherichia coli]